MGAFFKSFWNDPSVFKSVLKGALSTAALYLTSKGNPYGAVIGGVGSMIPGGSNVSGPTQ